MERIPDRAGDASKAHAFASSGNPDPELPRVAAPVEIDSQPRPSRLWDAVELFQERRCICTVEPAERVDRHRTIAGRIFGTYGIGSVHGGTCS